MWHTYSMWFFNVDDWHNEKLIYSEELNGDIIKLWTGILID